MTRRKSKRSPVFVVSVVAHLAVGAVLALIPQEKLREVVAIALNEAPEKEKKPEPPKPEPHRQRPASTAGRNVRPAAARAEPAATAAQAPIFTDIGLALDSSSSDGLAVNIAPPVAAPQPVIAAPARPKVLMARATEHVCTEELVKARPLAMVRPGYTDQARRARAQGRVRIQLTVNERGEVESARVLSGLGYGLDEAAIAAAHRLHFTPATRCGRAVSAPFILAMRFVLGT